MVQKRDYKIDFIRAVCSLLVILAHVGAPRWMNQIRTFDVVALVLVSGMSLQYDRANSYKQYIKKRIKKLLIPTYAILAIVFSLSAVMCCMLHIKQLYSINQIICSFLLLNEGSMGYVWIVRVYLMIAIITPVIKATVNRIKSYPEFLAGLFVAFSCSYLLLIFGENIPNGIGKTFYFEYLYSSYIYSLIAGIGFYCIKHKENILKTAIVFASVFVLCQLYLSINSGTFILRVSDYKFPPQIYYCSYGLFIVLFLYSFIQITECKPIIWLSNHSFDIYLWHIVILRAVGVIGKVKMFSFLDENWIVKYCAVTVGAILIVYIWNYIEKVRRGYNS